MNRADCLPLPSVLHLSRCRFLIRFSNRYVPDFWPRFRFLLEDIEKNRLDLKQTAAPGACAEALLDIMDTLLKVSPKGGTDGID